MSSGSPNLAATQTKYSDQSPLVRYANRQYFQAVRGMLSLVPAATLLDAGCGEGLVLSGLSRQAHGRLVGIDLDPVRVKLANAAVPNASFVVADLHCLPIAASSFGIVLMLEVLEHVGRPEVVLREAYRVTRRFLVASVPHEPWWRIGNMLRLKYLRNWGNTPEHLHHWSAGGFRKFVAKRFNVLQLRKPFLWTFILAEKQT